MNEYFTWYGRAALHHGRGKTAWEAYKKFKGGNK